MANGAYDPDAYIDVCVDCMRIESGLLTVSCIHEKRGAIVGTNHIQSSVGLSREVDVE